MTVIIFLIVLSILIFVHEAGHFVMAKRSGMKVEEFGFGFPPRLWGFKRGETIYSINWIPFGGFVRIYGEDGEHRDAPRSFGAQTFWAKLKVVLAGVVMNFVLAAVLLMIGNFFGLRIGLISNSDIAEAQNKQVQVISVSEKSPAAQAGLQILDEIKGFKLIDGTQQSVERTEDVQNFVRDHSGQTVTMLIQRGGQIMEKTVQLRANPPAGQGPLGISLALTGVVTHPWYVSLWKGISDAAIITVNTVYGFYYLFKELLIKWHLVADVSGPIGIAKLTGQAAQAGFSYLIQFVAMISINLAVLNAIPFPALDGGRAFLLIVEKLKGSPLNKKVEMTINAAGFFILIALMILVTARDISKLF